MGYRYSAPRPTAVSRMIEIQSLEFSYPGGEFHLSIPELNVDAVRELGLYSYRIVYEIKSDKLIEVLAVIHKRQHLEAEDIPRGQ